MSKMFLYKYLPLILLSMLLCLGIVTIFVQASNYGISADEPLQEAYGRTVMNWYLTLGRDTSFLSFSPDSHMPEHGGIFDAAVSFIQRMFPPQDHWYVRRIVTALTGLTGLVAIALCAYQLGGPWAAFLAALALWFYPRYYGAIYNNPKDVPAVVTMTLTLWGALLLTRHWEQGRRYLGYSVLVGFFIGLAASIRVTSVIWYAILMVIAVAWWLLRGRRIWREGRVRSELIKQFIAAIIIGLTSWLTMMALWPYVFLSPITNLLHSIKVLSQYPWDGLVVYDGLMINASKLPSTYTLKWLVIGSPLILILFMLVGLGLAYIISMSTRRIDARIAIVFLSFAIPLGAIIVGHAVVYDSLRQFLFLVPPMILIAVYGFVQTWCYLLNHKQKVFKLGAVGLAVLTLASYGLVAKEMIDLSPFEYTYFSPLVGGLPGAAAKFDTDYWGICTEQAVQWLNQNYQHYTSISAPTVNSFPFPLQMQTAPFLSPVFHLVTGPADFYIITTRDNIDQGFSSYRIIHVVTAENVPLCVIKINPAIAR